jgi:hypothetical protein
VNYFTFLYRSKGGYCEVPPLTFLDHRTLLPFNELNFEISALEMISMTGYFDEFKIFEVR